MDLTEKFAAHRPMLFALAHRMLGSVADTEVVLQKTRSSGVSDSSTTSSATGTCPPTRPERSSR